MVRQGGERFPLSIPSFPAVANACFVFMGRVVSMVEASIVSSASGWTSSDSAGEFGDDGGWAMLIELCTNAENDNPQSARRIDIWKLDDVGSGSQVQSCEWCSARD